MNWFLVEFIGCMKFIFFFAEEFIKVKVGVLIVEDYDVFVFEDV